MVTVVSVRQEERIVVTSRQWDRDGGWRREKIILKLRCVISCSAGCNIVVDRPRLLSYLALVINQSWRRLAGSWTDPEILSDVAQCGLQERIQRLRNKDLQSALGQ